MGLRPPQASSSAGTSGSGLIWVLSPGAPGAGLHLTRAGCFEAPLFWALEFCHTLGFQLQGRKGESGVSFHHSVLSSPEQLTEPQSSVVFYTYYYYTSNSHSLEKNYKIQTNQEKGLNLPQNLPSRDNHHEYLKHIFPGLFNANILNKYC